MDIGSSGFIGHLPKIELDDLVININLENLPDHCGNISQDEAEAILADMPPKSWLLRTCQTRGKTIVSHKNRNGEIEHIDCFTGNNDGTKLLKFDSVFQVSRRQFGVITRGQAESYLANTENGTWLMRFSANNNSYVTSEKKGGVIEHNVHRFSSWVVDGVFKECTLDKNRMLMHPKFPPIAAQ